MSSSTINIGSETLTDQDVVEIVSMGSKERFVLVFDQNKKCPVSLPDFGTVFIGFTPEEIPGIENLDLFLLSTEAPLVAPESWKVGHLAKRLGMFPSVSQAIKNGFGNEIPVGFSQVQLRVQKTRGILSILKKEAV